MAITITRDLNMVPVGVPPVIHLSQYDDDFSLVFNLYSSVGTFTVESSTTAEIRGTKEDGYGYSANATIDISNKRVTVAGNNQMTACAGQNTFELVLKKNNKVLSTVNFILDVERAALDAGTITDQSVLKELNAIIASAATATQAAEDAEDAADRAEEAAQTLEIDDTLTHAGQAADAKKTGDEISALRDDLTHVGVSESVKVALLSCFAHVTWINEHGQTYYDALEAALYESDYPRITATFNPGINIIYTDDSLDTLKQYLVVKYQETRDSQATTVPSTDYTLSGVLSEGENTVRVNYNTLSTTFIVEAIDFYNIWTWKYSTGQLTKLQYGSNPNQDSCPTRIDINPNDARRTFIVQKGKAPYYFHQDDQWTISPYYPIPIPAGANYYTVKGVPTGYYFYTQVFEYDPISGTYLNARADSRFAWTQQTSETPLGHEIVGNNGNYFFGVNLKDSSSSSHVITTEPTELEIVFSTTE